MGAAWGRRLVGAAGLALASAAILSTVWVVDILGLGILLCLTFIGNDLAMGPAWAAAADIGLRQTGTLAGAMNMLNGLMAALGVLATGALFEAGHVVLPFVLFAVSYALGAFCWLNVEVPRTSDDSPRS